MKGDKTNEGRQGGNGSQEQPRMEIMQGDKMKGGKAAGAAKSSPEWRSCRETNGPFGDCGDQQPNL